MSLAKQKAQYQFTPFDLGQIKAHMYHGLGATEIARILRKADGKGTWSDESVRRQMAKFDDKPTAAYVHCWILFVEWCMQILSYLFNVAHGELV